MSSHRQPSLARGPLLSQLVTFSLPLVMASLLQYLYQFADMAILGHLEGEAGLVAISNAASVVFVLTSLIMGLTSGGSVVVARLVGARDLTGQRHAYLALLLIALGGSALVALGGAFGTGPLVLLLNVPEPARSGTGGYLLVTFTGSLAPFLMQAACSFARAQGDSRVPLLATGASALLNVVLDLILVGPGGLGVVGAAWATVCAQAAAAVLTLLLARRRYASARGLRQALHERHLARNLGAMLASMLKMGLPAALQQVVVNLSYVFVAGILNAYGSTVAAAAGVGLKASTLAGLPCWAMGQAITTATAQSLGAGVPQRAAQVVKGGVALSVGVTLLIQVTIQACAPGLVGLLGSPSPEVTRIAVLYLRITCSVNGLFYATMYACDSFALATRVTQLVLLNSLVDALVMRVGLALVLSASWGYLGVFAAQAAAPVIPAIIGAGYARSWTRRNARGHAKE